MGEVHLNREKLLVNGTAGISGEAVQAQPCSCPGRRPLGERFMLAVHHRRLASGML